MTEQLFCKKCNKLNWSNHAETCECRDPKFTLNYHIDFQEANSQLKREIYPMTRMIEMEEELVQKKMEIIQRATDFYKVKEDSEYKNRVKMYIFEEGLKEFLMIDELPAVIFYKPVTSEVGVHIDYRELYVQNQVISSEIIPTKKTLEES